MKELFDEVLEKIRPKENEIRKMVSQIKNWEFEYENIGLIILNLILTFIIIFGSIKTIIVEVDKIKEYGIAYL